MMGAEEEPLWDDITDDMKVLLFIEDALTWKN